MRRADRLFQIVQILRRESLVTANGLAQELEVSVRTIYRDVQDLIASGVPIDGEAGVGYCMSSGFDLPPLMFDRGEIEALVLGLSMAESFADEGVQRASRSALSKIAAVLPERLETLLHAPRMHAVGAFVPSKIHFGMDELREAIHAKHRCRVEYRDASDRATDRILWPLGLYFWGQSWTLAAWCELREAFRSFRLDRLNSVEVLPSSFAEAPGRSLHDFVEQQRSSTHQPYPQQPPE